MADLEFQLLTSDEELRRPILWNGTDLRTAVQTMVADYNGVLYSDDQEAIAKEDRAKLNKLKKALTDAKKKVKSANEIPYDVFATEMDAVVKIVDDAIKSIDEQTAAMLANRKALYLEKARAVYDKTIDAAGMSEWLPWNKLLGTKASAKATFEDRWTTKSCWSLKQDEEKNVREDMEKFLGFIQNAIETIKSLNHKYEADGLAILKATGDLSKSLAEMTRLQAIDDERERIRQEAIKAEEERRRREEIERARREEEARIRAEQEKQRAVEEAERRAREQAERERIESERRIREEEERKRREAEEKARAEERARIQAENARLFEEQQKAERAAIEEAQKKIAESGDMPDVDPFAIQITGNEVVYPDQPAEDPQEMCFKVMVTPAQAQDLANYLRVNGIRFKPIEEKTDEDERNLAFLSCLESAGVDNWSYYGEACDMLEEMYPEDEE